LACRPRHPATADVLLSESHALVADFGIARALEGSEEALTSTGMAIGTPAYMSPEQASGSREVDGRTDVYALGCVLFEMLAGEPPYTGPSAQAIMARALTETPRPIHPTRAGVPEAVDHVIAKAMAPTPADRYVTAREFGRALNEAHRAAPHDTAVRGEAGRRRILRLPRLRSGRQWAVLTVGLVLAIVAVAVWRSRPMQSRSFQAIAVLPFENLGVPEDNYFADGVADRVREGLLRVAGLRVIARSSASQYLHSTMSPMQIAQELGAPFLLYGRVRWQKGSTEVSRVQLTVELVHAGSGPATTMWQEAYDAPLSGVFAVQGAIAGRVARELGVVISDSLGEQLNEAPTGVFAAYDAYLRGQEESKYLSTVAPAALRNAADYYARAGDGVSEEGLPTETGGGLRRERSFSAQPTASGDGLAASLTPSPAGGRVKRPGQRDWRRQEGHQGDDHFRGTRHSVRIDRNDRNRRQRHARCVVDLCKVGWQHHSRARDPADHQRVRPGRDGVPHHEGIPLAQGTLPGRSDPQWLCRRNEGV
jgi:serine/threonine-protein kinase